jgi:hypothetical protein
MKNDKTESEIFAQIKLALDTYQEDYIPGSWENYLNRSKAKKRKLFLRIASGIAACLLLGFVGSQWIHFEKPEPLKLTAQQTAVTTSKQTLESGLINKGVETGSAIRPATSLAMLSKSNKSIKPAGSDSKANPGFQTNLIAAKENDTPVNLMVTNIAADSIKKIADHSKSTAIQQNLNITDVSKFRPDTISAKSKFTVPDTQTNTENQNLADGRKRKVRFGINFSPGVSTAQSSSSFNYTGGLSADISLFANFQLSTGLQVENQNIVQKSPGFASSSYLSSTTAPLNQSRTKLINLDIPVNITWKFYAEKKNTYYVSAGLSSLVYLRQDNKNTTYSQDMIPVSSIVAGQEVTSFNAVDKVSVTENTAPPDQTFDFAGRVNIMVGFEKKLSKKLSIHLEPYAKIPASGLAPGNLNHTSTGINFKISF